MSSQTTKLTTLTTPTISSSLEDNVEKIKNQGFDTIPKFVISIIILIIFYVVATWLRDIISGKTKVFDITNKNFTLSEIAEKRSKSIFFYEIGEIVFYLIMIFGVVYAISNLGFQIPTAVAILGTFAVGIGLSVQNTIGNIWAGIYISLSHLYEIGDNIGIGTVSGKVVEFTLFNTVVFDEKTKAEITIPNTTIQNGLLTNFSKTH